MDILFNAIKTKNLALFNQNIKKLHENKFNYCEYSLIYEASILGLVDFVRVLLDEGLIARKKFFINDHDLPNLFVIHNNNTYYDLLDDALFIAITRKHIQLIELLIQFGANVNKICCLDRLSHFQNAIKCALPFDTIKFMIDHGADVNLADFDGDTPLFYAVRYNKNLNIIKLLINSGASTNIKFKHNDDIIFWNNVLDEIN